MRSLLRAALVSAALLVTVAACAGDEPSTTIEDFAEIQQGPITVTPGAGAMTAVLEVETTIDVVCAVAYGTDESLGSIATDSDMQGGAHSDHSPLMVGLQPGTTYFYRLQGVAADGRIFRSELFTFSTPPASEAGSVRENAAIGAGVVDVSSEFSDAFAAGNAVDGDLATEWSSRGDGDGAYIVIDLGRPVEASGVGFRTREMTDGSSITTSYSITVDEADTFGPFPAGPGLHVADVEFSGQVVRFDVESSTGGNTGVIEVEVYPEQ